MTAPTDGDPGAGGGGRSGPEAGRQRSRPAPTATGRSVLTAGVALVVLGWSLGYPVLAVIGLGGLLAVAAALAAVTRQPTPEVERRLEPLRVARGQAALGVVTVGAAGGRRSAACVAVEPVGNRQVRVRLPSLPPGRRTSVPYRLPTDRRGAVPVGPLTLLRQDPLGLCAGHQAVGGVATLWAAPTWCPSRPGPGAAAGTWRATVLTPRR